MSTEVKGPSYPVTRFPIGYVSCLCSSKVTRSSPLLGIVARQQLTWLISGTNHTNSEGVIDIAVNNFLDVPACANAKTEHSFGPAIIRPGLFVATPMHDTPSILTVVIDANRKNLGYVYGDVFDGRTTTKQKTEWEIIATVSSWNLLGAPLPQVAFSWIYIAEAALRFEPIK